MEQINNCPHCNKTFDWIDPIYCPYCGALVSNQCTNPDCAMCPDNYQHEVDWCLNSEFMFCPDCGSITTFKELADKSEVDFPQ